MTTAKIATFLRGHTPGAIALTGNAGCGKRHAITEAARQAGVAVTNHDLAQGTILWGRLGSQQLTSTGLAGCVHVVSNASEQFLTDFAFAKKTKAKIILVADDAGPSMRASGVPVVRMPAMTAEAMTKYLFHELDWPAEDALRAARAAGGDWHQLLTQQQFGANAVGEAEQSTALEACSGKDDTLANEPTCLIANRLLNGTAPEVCPLDASTMAWVERNLPVHCEGDREVLAQKQGLLAAATEGWCAGSPTGEELFKRAAGFRSKRVHYRQGLYGNPCEKDDAAVREIAASFKRQRTTHSDSLKERARLEESGSGGCDAGEAKKAQAKSKPKANAKGKARAKKQPAWG